jgi:hypothetical protein
VAEPCCRVRLLTYALAAAVAVAAMALIPLIPTDYRPWNFAAFGAVGLFVAARGGRHGLLPALAFGLGAKLLSDLLNYVGHAYDPLYLPFTNLLYGLTIYSGLALYPLLGWGLLRRTEHPLRIGGTTVAAGLVFFLTTNCASWLYDPQYEKTALGLLQSYWNGLPFLRGTLTGDLTFAGVLFGLYAVLVRVPFGRPVPATVDGVSQ